MKPPEHTRQDQPQTPGATCQVTPPSFCTPEELAPLLQSLRANEEISGRLVFPRGTLLEDGRLDLCKQDLGPEGIRRVAEALRHNTQVTSLLLGADHLGPEGAVAVADLLQDHQTIKTIYMGCNRIGPQGAKALSEALAENPRVRGLWLKRNAIGPGGAEHLAALFRKNRRLRTIDLVSNDLGPEGARLLAEALAGEENVLESLYLCGNQLGPEGTGVLAPLLERNASLSALYLSLNRIGDEGAALLASLLKKNRSLTTLGLASNDIGPEGARALAEALRHHPSLETLELGFAPATAILDERPNRVGDEGALAFAALLREDSRLCALDLSQNDITLAGARALIDALEQNQSLTRLKLGVGPVRGLRSVAEEGGSGPSAALELLDDAKASTRRSALRPAGVPYHPDPHLSARSGALEQALKLPQDLQSRLMALLCRNSNRQPKRAPAPRPDENNIKSVYRTARAKSSPEANLPAPPVIEEPPERAEVMETARSRQERGFRQEELAACVKVLKALHQKPQILSSRHQELEELRLLLTQLMRRNRREDRRLQSQARARRRDADRALLEATGLRRQRTEALPLRPADFFASSAANSAKAAAADSGALHKARRCYVCKEPFTRLHFFYDSLCPGCAALNFRKRGETADLSGRVALVTGGRIIIGFQVVLRLLRAGARVLATTRFPHDAARRFAKEPDFASFQGRLRLYGLDLRHIPSVERFTSYLEKTCARLDILIHNAAQTVYKPPAFYDHLKALESLPPEELPTELQPLLGEGSFLFRGEDAERALLPSEALMFSPTEDGLRPAVEGYEELLFPPGSSDVYGQPLDLRARNSWRLRLDEVSTPELLAVQLVNAIAPFLLNSRLKRLMMRVPDTDKYIVNVSAMEGQFYRANKTDRHPHTNMAKAALNMMTRTSASDYAGDRIYMNSVDTGWITNQNPYAVSRGMEEHGFQTPLDEIDAAARICDPVFTGVNTQKQLYGYFLKDYRPVAW